MADYGGGRGNVGAWPRLVGVMVPQIAHAMQRTVSGAFLHYIRTASSLQKEKASFMHGSFLLMLPEQLHVISISEPVTVLRWVSWKDS